MSSKNIKNKKIIRKTMKNKMNIIDSISNLNNLLQTLKLYHWTTDYFNIHKITDTFIGGLSSMLDNYVEVYLGSELDKQNLVERKLKIKLSKVNIKPISKKSDLLKKINLNINTLKLTNHSVELNAIRDELISELQKFKYLLNLK